ncbi:hypothetical protein [Rhodopirellula baltica]
MIDTQKPTTDKPGTKLVGCAVLGACLTGFIAMAGGVLAILQNQEFLGGGVLLIGSALSFGLLLNALRRD